MTAAELPCATDEAYDIAANASTQSINVAMAASMGAYPGAADNSTNVTGTVTLWAASVSQPLRVYYRLAGMEPSTSGGIHVHTGTSCDDASTVGGHYWTPMMTTPDPWATTMWTSDSQGTATFPFLTHYSSSTPPCKRRVTCAI